MPEIATSCSCSWCRRTGGIWAYYPLGGGGVAIHGHPEYTESYVWDADSATPAMVRVYQQLAELHSDVVG